MSDETCSIPITRETIEVGIDSRLQRDLSNLITNEEISLDALPQPGPTPHRSWDKDDIVEYGKWLCVLLDRDPETGARPPSVIEINRAARIGLGPSRYVIRRVFNDGVTGLHEELGFIARDRYKLWTRKDCIQAGIELASSIGRRPGTQQFKEAHARGDFLSVPQIINRFGSIQNFQELIGRPSVRGWSKDDFKEWGAAVKRQNGSDFYISSNTIRMFSEDGKGPNYRALAKRFPTLAEFNRASDEELEYQLSIEEEDLSLWRSEAKREIDKNEELGLACGSLSDEQTIEFVAKYRLISAFETEARQRDVISVALRKDSDSVAQWIVANAPAATMALVENTASLMRMFNILWPMYRFQSVDLQVPPRS